MAQSGSGDSFGLRARHALAAALGHSEFADLLPGLPRLRPCEGAPAPNDSMAGVLRPYCRWLWRQRAQVLLARAALVASAYILVAHYVLIRLLPSAADALVWLPALVLVFGAGWLAAANRPGIHETACWLDRRFELHDQLGTALELGEGAGKGSLAQRQAIAAMVVAGRLPSQPMEVRHAGPWLLAGAVLAAGLLSMVIPGHVITNAQPASPAGPASRATALPRPAARAATGRLLHPQAPLKLPPSATRPSARGGSKAAATSVPLLSSSLQIRLAPDSGATTQQTAGGAPRVGSLPSGSSQGTKAARQPASTGSQSQSAQQQTGSGSSSSSNRQGSSQQNGTSGTSQGQQGSANTNDQSQQGNQQQLSDGAQTLPDQSPAGSTSPGGQGQTGQPPAQSSTQLSGRSGGTPQANPFGADPAAPKHKSSQPPPSNSTKYVKRGQTSANSAQLHGSTGTQQGVRTGGKSGDSPDDRPYNRSGSSQSPSPGGVRAGSGKGTLKGPVHTTTIQVEGKPTTGNSGGQAPDLVRVVPYGAQPGEAAQGPAGTGSATVEGYVPEQSIVLPPDEQALVQAYFSSGSSS